MRQAKETGVYMQFNRLFIKNELETYGVGYSVLLCLALLEGAPLNKKNYNVRTFT